MSLWRYSHLKPAFDRILSLSFFLLFSSTLSPCFPINYDIFLCHFNINTKIKASESEKRLKKNLRLRKLSREKEKKVNNEMLFCGECLNKWFFFLFIEVFDYHANMNRRSSGESEREGDDELSNRLALKYEKETHWRKKNRWKFY